MLKFLILIFLLAVFFVVRVLMKLSKISRNVTNRYNRRESSNSNAESDNASSNPKLFTKNEGKYVDYEEVKEDK